jgi:hypothetical protein
MQEKIYEHYSSKISVLESELKAIKKALSRLYLLRLVSFLLFFALFTLFIRSDYNYFLLFLALSSFSAFLYTVKLDLKYAFRERFTTNKLLLNRNELKILDHQFADRETGSAHHHLNPHLAADFDLFGSGSLFQYLNRCPTLGGKQKLAEGLCQLHPSNRMIIEKQEAIRELVEKNEFVASFLAQGMFLMEKGNELDSLESWLSLPEEKSRVLPWLCILIPLLNVCWIGLVVLGFFSFNSLLAPILLSLTITGSNLKRINKAHGLLSKTAGTLKSYTTILRMMESEPFYSHHLTQLQGTLSGNGIKAGSSLTSLYKLLNSFDQRLNILVSVLLNALMLYDILIWLQLGKWKRAHKTMVRSWFEALSELDALASLSVYAFNNQESVTYPEISEEEFIFQATEIGHPLLHPDTRICNTFVFSGVPRILIVTGANMAGKSTFLRTLSVNLILAMNGAPVCAKRLLFTPCDILSSIKIQDSLSNNESYFYAELVRIREIIDHLKNNPKTLIVLDEILRGTNSKDKQKGSIGLLEKLISLKGVALIATHDLSLGDLEKSHPNVVTNLCFEVELTNEQLVFDYKLKDGISQKLNASFLMKKMGIID